MHWLLDPLQKHYADFEGRIGRQEFWMYVLCVFGISLVLSILPLGMLSTLISLGFFIPNIAMGADACMIQVVVAGYSCLV